MSDLVQTKKKKGGLQNIRRNQLIFCIIVSIIPLLQFFFFYICVNVNSIVLAFQDYAIEGGDKITKFVGFDNFKGIWNTLTTDKMFGSMLGNTFLAFFFTVIVLIPLTMVFAYYIFKKAFLGNFFKIMLFMPSVVSAIVLVLIYMYFMDIAIPFAVEGVFQSKIPMLYTNLDTRFSTIMFYAVAMGFGANVLMYLSSMNSINNSILEAARLDGAGFIQEFWYIILPSVYQTMVTFFIIGISTIFTNQLNLVSFMGTETPLLDMRTIGYYMFQQTYELGDAIYPKMSAMGIMISLIIIPVVFITKRLLEKFGPSAEA